jgi:RimJ/RimL family protein N-acetyltransferase
MTPARGPAYRIVTARLVMRCWEPRDAALIKSAIDENLEYLRPWMPWIQHEPQAVDEKVQLLRGFRSDFDGDRDYPYAIFDPDQIRVLGGSGLHTRAGPGALEIGYWIHKDFANRGLASEAAGALTRAAFELHGSERVEIRCAPENAASAAVARKLGFTHEATLRRRAHRPNGFNDSMIWTLMADEFRDTPAARIQMKAYDAAGGRIL